MSNKRVVNFSAGPATLPLDVLKQAQADLICYQQAGMSVMEMSHRSKDFTAILDETKKTCIDLLKIPDTHDVLFLQGGASLQFAMIPMNFAANGSCVDLIQTGSWTKKAAKEIKHFTQLNILASSEADNFLKLPNLDNLNYSKDAAYLHLCSNNTIYGTQWKNFPKSPIPIVADMSSDILSRNIRVSDFKLIFAGAQKNLGPAGVTLVIIDKNWAQNISEKLPSMLDYRTFIKENSLYNTPPTYGIYMIGLTLKWIQSKGGLDHIETLNNKKAQLLYNAIDESKHFTCPVPKEDRSMMNIVFTLKEPNEDIENKFVHTAREAGFVNLNGHRSIGGFRCSVYNAMPIESIEEFVNFLNTFKA